MSASTATVFISYAREDGVFVKRLRDALHSLGVLSTGDWQLTTGDPYEQRLREFILGAEAFLFVISPESVASAACRKELAIGVEHKKQILPLSHREHGNDDVLDSALRAPQWTFLRDGDDFDAGLKALVAAIQTDLELMDVHSRLLLAADDWHDNGRRQSAVLRGESLTEADAWLARTSVHPEKLPQPTAREVEFIVASRQSRARRTQLGIAITAIVGVALMALAIVAWIQRGNAIRNADEAGRQQRVAETNAERATDVGKRRLIIATLLLNPEGTKFSTVMRNPDGAGLTYGLGAWAQRVGTLKTVLIAFQTTQPRMFAETFGDGDESLALRLIENVGQDRGGVDQRGNATDPDFNLVEEPWLGRFKRAAEIPELQAIQLNVFIDDYLNVLQRLQESAPEIRSERGVAFMLDVARQHGMARTLTMVKTAQQKGGTSEAEMLRQIAQLSTERNPQFAGVIKRRRDAFLTTPYLTDATIGF